MIIEWSLLHHCFYAGCTPKKVAWFQKWWPSNAILKILELMMFKTEEQDMSSPKASTIIIIITGEPEGDDLEIVWENFEKEKENLRILNFTTSDHWITGASLKPQQTNQLTVVFSDVKFSCICGPAHHVVCLLGYILHHLRGLLFARTTQNNFTWISWNRFKILICQSLKSISGFNWGY